MSQAAEGCVQQHREAPTAAGKTGAQMVREVLVAEGVDVVFGYPGGAIMPTYDAMPGYPIHHVLVRHEQGAAHMADGYARASGRVGVAIATSGPGATNLVTGSPPPCSTRRRWSASPARSPPPRWAATPSRRWTSPASRCRSPSTTTWSPAPRTWRPRCARHSPSPAPDGPVRCWWTSPRTRSRAGRASCGCAGAEAALRGAAAAGEPGVAGARRELIDAAERPLILAGHGVLKAEASELLRAFAEKTGIPVASTLLGLGGFPASHPLSLGMICMHGEAWVNTSLQEADLLIALGMRFDDRVTGSSRPSRCTRGRSTPNPSLKINKNVRVDVALPGDLRQTLEQLTPAVKARARTPWIGDLLACRARRRAGTCRRCPVKSCSRRTCCTTSGGSPGARRWWPPTSASTRCGRRSITSTSARDRCSPPAASAPWASRCLPPSARVSPAPRRKSGWLPATAGSR